MDSLNGDLGIVLTQEKDAGRWVYEEQARSQGYSSIAGLDEAGRGPLAGPVVAAAVILPVGFEETGIRDSKAISPKTRDKSFDKIMSGALAVGVGIVDVKVIDEINILRATHAAMKAALNDLGVAFDYVLVDGLPVQGLPAPSLAIVKGDAKCISIAAASIIAKVTRDRMMLEMDKEFPGYGFAGHKGYCTKEHLEAIDRLGPCPCHRRSFAPVYERIRECRLPGLE